MRRDPVPAPDVLAPTRRSWHLLAAHVVAEERYRRLGHSGLQPTPTGFRTAGEDPAGVEVELDHLVVHGPAGSERRPVTTVGAAQAWVLSDVGPPSWGRQPGLHDPPEEVAPATPLPIDPEVAAWLGGWLHLGVEVLGALVAEEASTDAGEPTLWPEHFDVGTELLSGERRASYGVSPGDEAVATPYAYVVPWTAPPSDPRWNAPLLGGASLSATELVGEDDPAARLLAWFRERRDLLQRSG